MTGKSAEKSLYFIAVVPSGKLSEELWEMKRSISEQYNTRRALNSPPHITLHMPFKWRNDREQILIDELIKIKSKAFTLDLTNYGSFPPRVIYVNAQKNETLDDLYGMVKKTMKKLFPGSDSSYKDQGFTPHCTLAFRDLSKTEFHKAWDILKDTSYSASQRINSYWLLKHDGKRWELFQEFSLQN